MRVRKAFLFMTSSHFIRLKRAEGKRKIQRRGEGGGEKNRDAVKERLVLYILLHLIPSELNAFVPKRWEGKKI